MTTVLSNISSPHDGGAAARVACGAVYAGGALIEIGRCVEQRARALAAVFESIARTRMAGVPVLNPALRVETIGFQALPVDADEEAPAALGILITPWFMNLVRLPLQREAASDGVGRIRSQAVGVTPFEFIGAHEPDLGAFSACSLFSPMFEFVDHTAARDTAVAVLENLRAVPAATPVQAVGAVAQAPAAARAAVQGGLAVQQALAEPPRRARSVTAPTNSTVAVEGPVGAPVIGAARAQTALKPSRDHEPPPARRAFLFGRSAVRGTTP